jgi:hypothetical protein
VTTLAFDILVRDKGSDKFDKFGKSVDKQSGRFDKFKKAAAVGLAAVGAAAIKFGADSVRAYVEAEQSQARLEDAFRKFPALADSNLASFQALNTELAKKTRFDDDATASGQAVLAQFKLTGTQIEQLTPLLQDYAAKTGKDLPIAARDLGKAVLGTGGPLKKIGIDFKDAGSASKNFDQIMAGLRGQVGGFAEKEGKTAGGQAEILKNRFGEIQEAVGQKLVPILTKLGEKLLDVIGFFERNGKVIGPVVAIIGTFGVTLIAAGKAVAILNAALSLMGISTTVALGPIGLIIAGVAALAVGLVIAYKKSETFRNIVNKAFDGVKLTLIGLGRAYLQFSKIALKGIAMVVDAFLGFVQVVLDGAVLAFGWIPGVGPKLKQAQRGFANFAKGVADKFDDAIAKVDEWDANLSRMQKTVVLNANIRELESKLAKARKELKDPNLTKERRATLNASITKLQNALSRARAALSGLPTSKIITVSVQAKVDNQLRGRFAFASGTRSAPRGVALVGEEGPELVKLRGGERIWSAAETRRMARPLSPVAAQSQTAAAPMYVTIMVGGERLGELIIDPLRNSIRSRGGDVQAVLGKRTR